MHPLIFRFIVIFGIVVLLNSLRLIFARIEINNNLERPTKFQRFFLGVQVFITLLMGFMAFLGFVMKDAEMAIVSSVLTVIFLAILFGMRRKFKNYYEEYEEYFWLKDQYAVDRIYYENITDWIPLKKQIGVLDATQLENRYIVVNLVFHDPEILLKKLAEMTFSGKFKQTAQNYAGDPNREQAFIEHLEKNGYGYIVEEYLRDSAQVNSDLEDFTLK